MHQPFQVPTSARVRPSFHLYPIRHQLKLLPSFVSAFVALAAQKDRIFILSLVVATTNEFLFLLNFSHPTMSRSLFLSAIFWSSLIGSVLSHEDHGGSCESSSNGPIMADFRPGIVTVDGHGDDWSDVDGFEFSLLPALDPDEENKYKGGQMSVKARFFLFFSFLSGILFI